MPKEFKYKTVFESTVKASCPTEKGVSFYLAKASTENLQGLLPKQVDFKSNVDLLATVGNLMVVNMINKNGDGIDTATLLKIQDLFLYKPQDIEHDRGKVVGCSLNYGYSSYQTNEILTQRAVAKTNEPFNFAIGGVVWKLANPDFTKALMEASDPENESYLSISMSWEIGFDDYQIVTGSRFLKNATVISDPVEMGKYEKYLQCNATCLSCKSVFPVSSAVVRLSDKNLLCPRCGSKDLSFGKGKMEDGTFVGRKIVGGVGTVYPIGVGFTDRPAADVKGVLSVDFSDLGGQDDDANDQKSESNATVPVCETEEIPKNESSKTADLVVKANDSDALCGNLQDNNLNKLQKNMKIAKIEDLLALVPNESKASVTEFIADQIKAKSDEFEKQLKEKEGAMAKAQEDMKKMQGQLSESGEKLKSLQESLTKIEQKATEAEKNRTYQERMASLDNDFKLGDEDRRIVADEIKDLDDAAYAKWHQRFSTIANDKKKTVIASKEAADAEMKQKLEDALKKTSNPAVASEAPKPAEKTDAKTIIAQASERALDSANVDKPQIPNASGGTKTIADEIKEAFDGTIQVSR